MLGGLLALVAGPLLGALLIFATSAPLALLNVIAGVVYAVALPFVALVTCYVYFDARTRHELEPQVHPDELAAEISARAEHLPHTYTLQAGKEDIWQYVW